MAWVAVIFVAAMTYTLVYCGLYGYQREADSLSFVLWFPDWVFWGIVAPWTVCTIVSSIFALFIMRDEPLGDDPGQEEGDDA